MVAAGSGDNDGLLQEGRKREIRGELGRDTEMNSESERAKW